ncbi:MAG: hypothetical protein ACO1N6_01515 [Microcella sp.]
MRSVIDERGDASIVDDAMRRLVVCWQHPLTRAIEPIGLLSSDDETFRFEYLARASEVEGFRPLLGFPEFASSYESKELFPFFAQRVMDPRRPDFARYLQELAVEESESTPWELLARTQGKREGDTILLYPVPRQTGDGWHWVYLVHGIRHLMTKSVPLGSDSVGPYSHEELETILSELSQGDVLELYPEPSNEWSDSAMLVLDAKGRPFGYVPDLLLEPIHSAMFDGKLHNVVEKVNGPEAGWHLRVLVRAKSADADGLDLLAAEKFKLATSQ